MSERDELLWDRWQRNGSAQAFGDLTQRYAGMVYSACQRMLHDDFAAEDAARAVFLDLMHQRGSLGEPVPVWLYRATVRHAESRKPQGETLEVVKEADHTLETDQLLALQYIDAAILGLPEQLLQVTVYRFLADYSHGATATALETTEAAIRQRISKAIERLRLRLEDFQVTLGAAALTGVLSSHLVGEAPGSLVDTVERDAAAAAAAAPAPGENGSAPGSPQTRRRSGIAAAFLAVIVLLLLSAAVLWYFDTRRDSDAVPADAQATEYPAEPEAVHAAMPPETLAIVGAGLPLEEGELDIVVTEVPAMETLPTGTGSITGRITDTATGEGLSGIAMAAFDPERGVYAGTRGNSDASGSFTIASLPAGNYVVLPINPLGYRVPSAQDGRPVQVAEGQTVSNIYFPLEPLAATQTAGAAIAGQVRDQVGNPVGDATIGVDGAAPAAAISGSDGRYRLADLPDGTYDLSVTKDGYRPARLSGVRSGSTTADVVLESTASLDAQVVSAGTGAPIPTFEVDYVDNGDTGRRLWDSPERIQSTNGGFVIDGLYAGRLTLGVRAEGYQPEVRELNLEPGAVERIEVALRAEGRFEGRVLNSAGEPVEGAYIFRGTVPQGPDWQQRAVARTDARGVYALEAAPPKGEYLTAFHPEYQAAAATASHGGTITLPEGGVILGTVTAAGSALAGAEVSVVPAGAPADRAVRTVTAADGRFEFLGLTPGEASVQVRHGTHGERQQTVLVRARERTTADFSFGAQGSVVRGQVEENGAPVSQAMVRLGVTTPDGQTRSLQASTDAQGQYHLAEVPAGQGRLQVDHQGMQRIAEFGIAAGETVVRDISFSGGSAEIAGRALGIDWSVFGASVLALQGEPRVPTDTGPGFFGTIQPHLVAQTEIESDGSFRLGGLPPGRYTVLALIVPRTGSGDQSQIRYTTSVISLEEGGRVNLNFDFNAPE